MATSAVAADVPNTWKRSAILANTSRSTAATGCQLHVGIETLNITTGTSEPWDRASFQSLGTNAGVAGLEDTLVVLARRLGRRGWVAGRVVWAALEVIVIPVPSLVALWRWLIVRGLVRNTAALSRMPVPTGWRALSVLGGRWGIGLTATRETALLPTEADDKGCKMRKPTGTSENKGTHKNSLFLQLLPVLGVDGVDGVEGGDREHFRLPPFQDQPLLHVGVDQVGWRGTQQDFPLCQSQPLLGHEVSFGGDGGFF